MSALRLGGFLATALLSSRAVAQTCLSYGVDFQTNGNYFQNISSTSPFTFASLFEGCDNDVANNILVDPNGEEYQCTDTPLQPDDTIELSTCPMDKNEMWSGDWSVLIISNNGNDDPIAYERDFYLSVGVPSTTTYTPTVTVTSTSTPLVLITETSTIVSITTLAAKTTTVASVTKSPTVTITPAISTVVVTKTATLRKTDYTVVPVLTTKTITASCSMPPSQQWPDPTCTITPTLVTAAALSTDDSASSTKSASAAATAATTSSAPAQKIRRGLFDRAVPLDRAARIAERKARREASNKLHRRAPDSATTTMTQTDTSLYITSTSVITGDPTTITSTTVATSTSTSTPPVVTVKSGKTTLPVVTTTLKQSTTTKTVMTVQYTTVKTITSSPTVTISSTTTNAQSAMACTAKGGRMT
ncbi:hypothetical protein E4T49_05550 [Aureobasidium sp. EXF-10728]|nr:hypothetical protein E4T49_05550 [Aureobasidium sp. EXF-10728]